MAKIVLFVYHNGSCVDNKLDKLRLLQITVGNNLQNPIRIFVLKLGSSINEVIYIDNKNGFRIVKL